MLNFQIVKYCSQTLWDDIEECPDATCFHNQDWSRYLKTARVGSPIVIQINDDERIAGWFVGIRKKLMITYIASPIEGTGTYTQGLVFRERVSNDYRSSIYSSLAQWLFDNHVCSFFKVDDWQLKKTFADWVPNDSVTFECLDMIGISYRVRSTLFLTLNRAEQELWNALHYKSAKYSINKAKKEGLFFSIINDKEEIPSFINLHYDQLVDVCNRHGMRPKVSQSKRRMYSLCYNLFPDKVIMFKVEGPDDYGNVVTMSTGIMCIGKAESLYFTGASYRQYQKYCPNEFMVWEAIKEMKRRGAGDLNFGGIASYKLKFGTQYAYVPSIVFSKYKFLDVIKSSFLKLYHFRRRLRATIAK